MSKWKCVHTFTSGSTCKLYLFGDVIEQEEYDMLENFEGGHFMKDRDSEPYVFSTTEYKPQPVQRQEVKPEVIKVDPKAGEMVEDGEDIKFK